GHGRQNRRPLLLTARLHYYKLTPERFWIPIQTIAADGGARPNSGGTPFRQPCPAYPSTIGQKAPQERFSEESFRACTALGNAFLYSSTASPLHTQPRRKPTAHSKPGCTRGTHLI